MMLTVIIPTRNRCKTLSCTLESISKQTLHPELFSVIVVDNGSRDSTSAVVGSFARMIPNLRYYYDASPGLHIGRHKKLREINSDIVVYADDDIEAFPTWLEGISEAFENRDVVLVGGMNLPKFESTPPCWILDMWRPNGNGHRILGYLSILDLGEKAKIISPQHVFGCNFSIRKSVLLKSGGFHPDAFPQGLIRFRGDGESHVSNYIQSQNLKTAYNPKASVYHWVSKKRMTVEYFCRRAYNQGISDSYTAVRKTRGTSPIFNQNTVVSRFMRRAKSIFNVVREKGFNEIPGMIWRKINENAYCGDSHLVTIRRRLALAYKSGYAFHQRMLKEDPKVIEWVLRENYFGENGKLPE